MTLHYHYDPYLHLPFRKLRIALLSIGILMVLLAGYWIYRYFYQPAGDPVNLVIGVAIGVAGIFNVINFFYFGREYKGKDLSFIKIDDQTLTYRKDPKDEIITILREDVDQVFIQRQNIRFRLQDRSDVILPTNWMQSKRKEAELKSWIRRHFPTS